MQGGFHGLRGNVFSLLLIVLACSTILIWAWERTPLLATFLPPKGLLQLSPEITSTVAETEAKEKQVLVVEKNGTADSSKSLIEAEGEQNQSAGEKEQNLDLAAPVGFANTSSPAREQDDGHFTTLMENHGKQNQTAGEKQQNLDLAAPVGFANTSSLEREQDGGNFTALMENHACNYAKGKWVVDKSRTLYSGFGCKQWLSPMWACRLMQRKDFTYEKLRWQPKNCQMEAFEGSKFLKRMKDKTMAFVGDSLGRQQFQSLMCMITGGKERFDVIDVGQEYGLVKPRGGVRPNGWAYRFPSTNTTVLYYWSACLCDLDPIDVTNPAADYAMHLDRPPAFLRLYLHKLDVLILNTGHHWNRGKLNSNRWVMYVGGMRNTNRKLAMIGNAKNFTIHSIINWVNAQLPKHPRLKAFYRSISPRHFVNGDWNTGGSCDNATPMSVGKEVLQNESSDYSAGNAVKGTGVKLLDITALSQVRDEGHISRYSIRGYKGVSDCLHWCLPGVPDTWNEILFAHITAMSMVQKE